MTVAPPLQALATFERVAALLSFGRAADALGVTTTAVSRTIRTLEARVGARLFNRTTRSVALTESGARLLADLSPALERIRASLDEATVAAGRPSGVLRLNTSGVAYISLIEPHVPAFLARHPEIALDVRIDNGLADIVAGGFDAGIRLGHALQRDMVAVPLGPLQPLVVVGSPGYLAARGTPRTPQDLLAHACIRQRLGTSERMLDWTFTRGAKTVTLDVGGRLVLNDMRATLVAAARGCGLACVFRPFAAAELANGALREVLERYTRPAEAFHLYHPSRSLMPGKLRAFVDFVRAANWQAPG